MPAKIRILGTSHISKESMNQIDKEMLKKPEIVAVELDAGRLQGLLNNAKPNYSIKNVKHVGLPGYLFGLVGMLIQKKLGRIVNVKPGSEMLHAVKEAKKINSKIMLIDQPIQRTLKKFSKKFRLRTFFRLVKDVATERKEKIKIDLNKPPDKETLNFLLDKFSERYPELYSVLVEERNQIMAENIEKIVKKYPESTILVVVGAGHVPGMRNIFSKKFKNREDKK